MLVIPPRKYTLRQEPLEKIIIKEAPGFLGPYSPLHIKNGIAHALSHCGQHKIVYTIRSFPSSLSDKIVDFTVQSCYTSDFGFESRRIHQEKI